jgi:uncharacterized phiE125 gp8 family phage protein
MLLFQPNLQSGGSAGNGAGSPGIITMFAPAGVASGSGSGAGAGSPGTVSLFAPAGSAGSSSSGSGFGSPGSVTIVRLEGQATGTVQDTGEPVTVEEAKQQLRIVDDSSEDALIGMFIESARAYVESESGYVFVARQFTERYSGWPTYLELGRRPVVTIDELEYQDSDGNTQTFTDYQPSLDLRRLSPIGAWPTLVSGGSVLVRYTAGFTQGEQVEEVALARQAILLLVAHWYANREAVNIGNTMTTEVPFAARALIDRFRAMVA